MKTWEIVNPSDYYTIQAESFIVAAAANLILGGGWWALDPVDGEGPSAPILAFRTWSEWWADNFDRSLKAVLGEQPEEVAAALESVTIGDRDAWEEARASGVTREEWEDAERTSLNNIGATARSLAEKVRSGDLS